MSPTCCGCSLQKGTKCIAILQIVVSLISIVLVSLGYLLIFSRIETDPWIQETLRMMTAKQDTVTISVYTVLLIAMAFSLLVIVGFLVLGIVLFKGAKQKSPKKLKVWLIVQYIFLTFQGFRITYGLFGGVGDNVLVLRNIMGQVVGMFFTWTVYAFKSEIESEDMRARAKNLKKKK